MSHESSSSSGIFGSGITLGGALAAYCSWTVSHSLGWAIVHLLCGWLYVFYWLFEYAKF